MTKRDICLAAVAAMKNSYSPYSHFTVGAALLTKSGKLYTGCNIENSAFGPTVCAERVAVFKAVSEGDVEFEMLAVVGGKNGIVEGVTSPCGVCRQVLSEFASPDLPVLFVKDRDGNFEEHTLGEILPFSFNL